MRRAVCVRQQANLSSKLMEDHMNIDERIEALTHTVELLAQMHIDNERANQKRFEQYDIRFEKVLGVIEQLTRVTEVHERRISHLEDEQ